MSGKFMKVKKVVIPTITMLIIASQLLGCAAASSKEMLAMLERQEAITIEVAEPISQEQGTQKTYEWVELASLDTYPAFRTTVDDILNITAHGTNGKNGILYVDLEGNHTNNSTMYFVFSNKKFVDNAWNNSETLPKLLEATKAIYADVETDAVAKVAFLNAYFNILPDAEPNYFNGNQTLTRAEYLSAVYRAGNPVSALETDVEFTSLVDPLGTNENTAFANQIADYSYLTITDESLNDKTFNGTISRAEAIYTIVRMYYNDEYESLTGKESSFSDIKNGGDILEKVGKKYFKENETTADAVKFGKSYELNYMLQNPDKGVTPELYKAMLVAKNHGLITGTECRWDEAITKAETINILSRVYLDLGTTTNANRGNSVGEVIDTPTENQDVPEATVHIYRDENKNIVYSEELANAIRSIEGVSNFSDEDFEEIMYSYYLRVRKLDNTVIYPEHINSAVVVVAHEKGYEVGAVTYLDGFTESVNIDTGSESTGNTGGGNGGNSSNNNSNTSENDFVTPETGSGSGSNSSDPWQGDGTFSGFDDLGDGGEYVTDPNESLLNP